MLVNINIFYYNIIYHKYYPYTKSSYYIKITVRFLSVCLYLIVYTTLAILLPKSLNIKAGRNCTVKKQAWDCYKNVLQGAQNPAV